MPEENHEGCQNKLNPGMGRESGPKRLPEHLKGRSHMYFWEDALPEFHYHSL